MNDLVELLRKLVSIPSINPLLTDDPLLAGETRMADFFADFLAKKKFRVEWHEITKGRPNIVARFGPDKPKRSLMLESHLDTQGIHGMTVPPFEGVVCDGKLYGRGACDTKGPMAAALFALDDRIIDQVAAADCQIVYVGAMGEEKGNIGAEELVELGVGADEAIVLEPTELHIVHAHKGALWFEVDVQGLAAHGSNPSEGVNAIMAMTNIMQKIIQQTDVMAKQKSNPLLGRNTVNMGVIRGGTSTNIVPDRCVLEVDRRTLPGDSHEKILDDVRAHIAALKKEKILLDGSVRLIKEGVPFETDAKSGVIRKLADACTDAGVRPQAEGAGWYSDAGPFSRTCKEVAVFGPGSIKQAHTADEFIELTSLAQGCEILKNYLKRNAHV